MVGDSYASTQRRGPEFYNAPTAAGADRHAPAAPARERADAAAPGRPGRGFRAVGRAGRQDRQAACRRRRRSASIAPIKLDLTPAGAFGQAFAAAASTEVTHDPDLDEAVIAFANADFEQCEQSLVGADRPRRRAAPSMPRPGWCCSTCTARPASSTSSRAWRSTTPSSSAGRRRNGSRCRSWSPRRPARSGRAARAAVEGQVGWVCPQYLDADGVAKLASLALQMPLPWVFDWGALQTIDAEACGRLSELFRSWIPQDLDMRWLSGDRLFTVHPGSRADRRARCRPGVLAAPPRRPAHDQPPRPVRRGGDRLLRHLRGLAAVVGAGASATSASAARRQSTTAPPLSVVSDVSTSFHESQLTENSGVGAGGDGRAVRPARRRHRDDAEEARRRARHGDHRQRLLRPADPGRLHRRGRPAQLGAGAAHREPDRRASSRRTGWWRCSSARWASTSTPRSRSAPSERPARRRGA